MEVPTPPILTQLNPGLLAPNDSPMEVPLYAKLRRRLAWWRLHATPEVVEIIAHGLPAPWIAPPPRPNFPYHRHTPEEIRDALTVMSEYLQVQAVHRVHSPKHIHYVPWFMVYKPKPRFISSCVDINARLRPPPYFRLPNWGKIFPYLVQGHFALKIDLKHAYFHLALCPELQKYFNFQIGHEVFQCDSACFGLHYIPYYWTQLMKTFSRKWRALGIVCFIYLDDIIILGPTRKYLLKIRPLVLRDLEAAGVTINFPKSILDPTQEFEALGFEVNLRCGTLNVPQHKRKGYRKEAGKVLLATCMTPRKVAAILGRFRSLLPAMPSLRAFTDLLVRFVSQVNDVGWDTPCVVPSALKEQVREITGLLREWPGRKFRSAPLHTTTRHLASDATPVAWGGLDVNDPRHVVHDFWRLNQAHINDKELIAAVNTTMSLARPHEVIMLDVDNSVVFSYLTKCGGKVPRLNQIVRPFLVFLNAHDIQLQVRLVPSQRMLADPISRWSFDPSEYSLNPQVFQRILQAFHPLHPHIDMFASPSNALLNTFCARWPHHQAALVDALSSPLQAVTTCFAHPPWTIIGQWLHRVRAHPHMQSLTLVPMWASELWWPLLMSLHVRGTPIIRIRPRWGLYRNCLGHCMKKPNWHLICILLSGAAYTPGTSRKFKYVNI